MALKGSKTEDNLKEPRSAGESPGQPSLPLLRQKADVEGYNDVAAVFRSTAEGETGHAHGHLEFLEESRRSGDRLADRRDRGQPAAAVAGETHEYTDMYPGMAKTAREEGFDEIADWFETLAKAEKSHAGRFQKASTARSPVRAASVMPGPVLLHCDVTRADPWRERQMCRRVAVRAIDARGARDHARRQPGSPDPPPDRWAGPDFYDPEQARRRDCAASSISVMAAVAASICATASPLFDLIDDSETASSTRESPPISSRSSMPAPCATCAS